SRRGKRFVGCSGYPKCTNTYPLPQSGKVEGLDEKCEECESPMVKIIRQRGKNYEMCLSYDCPTKDSWKNSKKD
ncbi:MAG: topoisomerase DNA-binding C4 zinc finger domain-containing protein, partial [archaeon]